MTSLWSKIQGFSQEKPTEIALIGDNNFYSWSGLVTAVENAAVQLELAGQSVIALYAENSPSWVIIDLACRLANVTLLPLPSFFSDQQLRHALEQAGVSAIVHEKGDRMTALLSLKGKPSTALISMALFLTTLEHVDDVPLPKNTAKITFTSGSTGTPKGVCLSNEQQTVVAESLINATQLVAAKHLCILPFSTLLENIGGIYAPLFSGGSIIAVSQNALGFNGSRGFDVIKLLATISHYQPDSMILLPELLLALVAAVKQGWKPPTSLTFIAVGGSRVAPALVEQARQCGLPVYEGYGLSECGSVVSLNTPSDSRLDSIGKVLNHVTVSIEDDEIIVSGNTFLGYIDEPASWEQSKLHTGDLGYFDDQGYLHIKGRKKNLLISSLGRNINPEWVESELVSNGLLKQTVVFGDAQPFCIALILPRSDTTTDYEIQQWIDTVNQQLPIYAHIVQWMRLTDALTFEQGLMTSNGRPIRAAIFKHYNTDIDALYQGNH